MTLSEVGDLILAPDVEILLLGNYVNRRGIRGYFVQIKCGNHWCKVSVSHADRHSARITVMELDGIDATMLQPSVIPNSSISGALKSSAAEETAVNTYVNSAAVEGIWAEFHHEGNWYMVSVSHMDVPVRATSEELERMADEFLLQQGSRKLRMRY